MFPLHKISMKLVFLRNSSIIFMYAPGPSSAAVCRHAWIISIVDEAAATLFPYNLLWQQPTPELWYFYEQMQ